MFGANHALISVNCSFAIDCKRRKERPIIISLVDFSEVTSKLSVIRLPIAKYCL